MNGKLYYKLTLCVNLLLIETPWKITLQAHIVCQTVLLAWHDEAYQ